MDRWQRLRRCEQRNPGVGFRAGSPRWSGRVAVSGIMVAFRGELFPTNAALVLVLPVLAAAILGGRVGGAVSAGVATLCFDFFFTRPYYSFTIDRRDDVETTIVLLAVGLVVGELVVRSRRSRRLAIASRREVDQVRRVAELAAGAGSRRTSHHLVEREVVELLGARGARFERPPFPTTLPRLGHGMVTLPRRRPNGDRPFGPATRSSSRSGDAAAKSDGWCSCCRSTRSASSSLR